MSAEVMKEPVTPRDPVTIHTELLDARGEMLSEADFEYVMLPPDRFKKAVALDELPDAYRRHFGEVR
jgi:hypothetical protein